MYERIVMNEKQFDYFPQRFTWRNRCYDIYKIERCWRVSQRHIERLHFQVHCEKDRFELFQDLGTGTWYVQAVASER
jgi:hypothetical protein